MSNAPRPEGWLTQAKMLLDGKEPLAASIILEKALLLPDAIENPVVGVSGLLLLASCYSRLMRNEETEAAYARGLQIADERLQPAHRTRLSLIRNWAIFERGRGALDAEQRLWQLILPTLQSDPTLAWLLRECQQCLIEIATLAPEERRLRQSFEEARAADIATDQSIEARGASFDEARRAVGELAALLGGMGRNRERSVAVRDGIVMRPEELWRGLTSSRDLWRRALLDQQRSRFNLFLEDAIKGGRREAAQSALETMVWRRGVGLEIDRCANHLARRDGEVRELLDTLRFNRANYAAELFAAPSDAELRPPRSTHRMQIVLEPMERSFDYQEWEARLLKRLEPEVNRFISRPATCPELASKIPADGLLIEFWRCTCPADQGTVAAFYVALVLPQNRPDQAAVVQLCDCATAEETLIEYLAALSGRSRTADVANAAREQRNPARARELGQTLRTLLLDPLKQWTDRAKHLLLVTDGLLGRLPFSTLPLGDDGHVIDEWLISYLHTARDLFGSDDAQAAAGPPLVISDPAYDWPGPFGPSSARSFRVERLEWAAKEGEAIGRVLGVTPLTGTDATKTALMACRSPEILHIATHGMLLPARPSIAELGPLTAMVWRDPGEARYQIPGLAIFAEGLGRLSNRQLPDQSLRSILALAGVNTWLDGFPVPDTAGNGVVNAEEIAALDLSGNKLTVLSACETGLGVIGIGEGVLGLRSSFTIAGAETVVMSLWAVNDQSTNELMVAFYENLNERRMGRAEALQRAQQTIRQQHPDDPYHWGPFIAQGAVGPIRL